MYLVEKEIRKTEQFELPIIKKSSLLGKYDIYPVHPVGDGKIFQGYDSLVNALAAEKILKLDGYVGIFFEDVREKLTLAFERLGVPVTWINVNAALLPADKIDALVEPYLGGDDPVFGKICPFELIEFFDAKKLEALSQTGADAIRIYYGIGSSLVPVSARTIFFDISKNEIQFRSRAGSVTNLGAAASSDPKEMYKRFYFVDWMVLNRHVNSIKERIDFFVDGQRSSEITWMDGQSWRQAIEEISKQPLRVRPWFEPGAWGGTWIKDNIDGLEKDVVNYAWSFELIVPENGVILESSGIMLESTFDSVMYFAGKNILGADFERFGHLFPIRFDFLDTFNGGNLSVQCHPRVEYIREIFGEAITQEETYYILDRQEGAVVYLGFQNGITPEHFRNTLEKSQLNGEPIDIAQYVQVFDANKHDLFLIPPGTIHASGKGNMVLEISSTPYIYTFKMYDWLRVDLDGRPRPMNIERGMENLNFERSGDTVENELISKPVQIQKNSDYALYHLPTHREHLYDVHRYVVFREAVVETLDKANVLSLVEGDQVEIVVNNKVYRYNYAETFVIPAYVKEYTIRNIVDSPIMVVKAFVK